MQFILDEKFICELDILLPFHGEFLELYSKDFKEINFYRNFRQTGEEWISEKLFYGEGGKIILKQYFNKSGELTNETNYDYKGNILIVYNKDSKTEWQFDERNLLTSVIFNYSSGNFDLFQFQYNDNSQLVKLNGKFKLFWAEEYPIELYGLQTDSATAKVLERTAFKTKVLYPSIRNKEKAFKAKTFVYDEFGRLIETAWGEDLTKISYTDDGIIKRKIVHTFFSGNLKSKFIEEEKLIEKNTTEKKVEWQDGINSPRLFYRQIMKTLI